MRISLWFQLFIVWLPQPVISEISWLFSDFFLTSIKFSWPTELKVLQISPENGLNAPLTAIPTAHLFMLSASHMQCTWTDSSLTYRAKRIDFLENPTSACCSISWTVFYQYNTIHVCKLYKCTLEISLFLTSLKRLNFPWLNVKFPEWTCQSLSGQMVILAGHCPLTGRYFEPSSCTADQ